jgi:hypothetical protein
MGLKMLASKSWAGLATENILRQRFWLEKYPITTTKYCLPVLAKNSLLTFVFYWFPQIIVIEVQEM